MIKTIGRLYHFFFILTISLSLFIPSQTSVPIQFEIQSQSDHLYPFFVDFENEARFDCVVDNHPDLIDLLRERIEVEFGLFCEIGRERLFDELATENSVDVRSDCAAAYHFGKPRTYDVVFERNIDIARFCDVRNGFAQVVEECRQSAAKFELSAEFAQFGVAQPLHITVLYEAEQVVEVDGFGGDAYSALGVDFGQHIDFAPKEFFVDVVLPENRRLHVSGD